MGPIDLGPDWFWRLIGICAIVGSVTVVVMIIKGIIWLLNHIEIV